MDQYRAALHDQGHDLDTTYSSVSVYPKFGGQCGGTEVAAHLTGNLVEGNEFLSSMLQSKLMISGRHRLALAGMDQNPQQWAVM